VLNGLVFTLIITAQVEQMGLSSYSSSYPKLFKREHHHHNYHRYEHHHCHHYHHNRYVVSINIILIASSLLLASLSHLPHLLEGLLPPGLLVAVLGLRAAAGHLWAKLLESEVNRKCIPTVLATQVTFSSSWGRRPWTPLSTARST
jgi:hypothetical protein